MELAELVRVTMNGLCAHDHSAEVALMEASGVQEPACAPDPPEVAVPKEPVFEPCFKCKRNQRCFGTKPVKGCPDCKWE